MRRLFIILFAFLVLGVGAGAQTRTYGDIEAKSFVIGLDQYYFGNSGSLSFKAAKVSYSAKIEGDTVTLECGTAVDTLVQGADTDYIVGIHDFTGDRVPELVVACRKGKSIIALVYQIKGGLNLIGKLGAEGDGITEVRVFRQAITIKNHKKGAMYTWTWHSKAFDFKASDGSSDPTPELD